MVVVEYARETLVAYSIAAHSGVVVLGLDELVAQ
jgi:hypothetical protein